MQMQVKCHSPDDYNLNLISVVRRHEYVWNILKNSSVYAYCVSQKEVYKWLEKICMCKG